MNLSTKKRLLGCSLLFLFAVVLAIVSGTVYGFLASPAPASPAPAPSATVTPSPTVSATAAPSSSVSVTRSSKSVPSSRVPVPTKVPNCTPTPKLGVCVDLKAGSVTIPDGLSAPEQMTVEVLKEGTGKKMRKNDFVRGPWSITRYDPRNPSRFADNSPKKSETGWLVLGEDHAITTALAGLKVGSVILVAMPESTEDWVYLVRPLATYPSSERSS